MKREDLHVGQTLLHISPGPRPLVREVTVTKVGRTNVHVDTPWGRPEAFRMDTGYAVRDFGGRVVTEAEHIRERAMRAVHSSLRAHGLSITAPGRTYPLETWAAVLELLDRARDGQA